MGMPKNCDVSRGYGSINIYIVYQQNVSKSLMNCNYRDDMNIDDNL